MLRRGGADRRLSFHVERGVRRGAALLVVGLALCLSACGVKRIERRSGGTGVLYGLLKNAYGTQGFTVHRTSTYLETNDGYVDSDGRFFFFNLVPGRYIFTAFKAGGVTHQLPILYMTKEESEPYTFEVKADGLAFGGSWEVRYDAHNKFALVRMKDPPPLEVLAGLLPAARGTGWDELMCTLLGPAHCPAAPAPLMARWLSARDQPPPLACVAPD